MFLLLFQLRFHSSGPGPALIVGCFSVGPIQERRPFPLIPLCPPPTFCNFLNFFLEGFPLSPKASFSFGLSPCRYFLFKTLIGPNPFRCDLVFFCFFSTTSVSPFVALWCRCFVCFFFFFSSANFYSSLSFFHPRIPSPLSNFVDTPLTPCSFPVFCTSTGY